MKHYRSPYEQIYDLTWLSRILTIVLIGTVLVAFNFMTQFDNTSEKLAEEHKQRVYAEELYRCLLDEYHELQEQIHEK